MSVIFSLPSTQPFQPINVLGGAQTVEQNEALYQHALDIARQQQEDRPWYESAILGLGSLLPFGGAIIQVGKAVEQSGEQAVARSNAQFLATAAAAEQERDMSLFADTNGWSNIVNTIGNVATAYIQSRNQPALSPAMTISPVMGALPPLARLGGGAVVAAGALAVRGGAAIARSAMTYCRRNPSWCATIGGTAAVAGLIESGQLPTIRRRRGRGITPRDLRSFKRVANLIRGFCPTVRRIPPKATRHVRGTGISHA